MVDSRCRCAGAYAVAQKIQAIGSSIRLRHKLFKYFVRWLTIFRPRILFPVILPSTISFLYHVWVASAETGFIQSAHTLLSKLMQEVAQCPTTWRTRTEMLMFPMKSWSLEDLFYWQQLRLSAIRSFPRFCKKNSEGSTVVMLLPCCPVPEAVPKESPFPEGYNKYLRERTFTLRI